VLFRLLAAGIHFRKLTHSAVGGFAVPFETIVRKAAIYPTGLTTSTVALSW
jgi:hypothetical protein